MKIGDIVWSVSHNPLSGKVIERRLAIIIQTDYDDYNPYFIQLIKSGRQGKTSIKYLEPLEEVCK